MSTLRRLFVFLLLGSVIGAAVAMLFAPSIIVWFHTPIASSANCNCTELANSVTAAYLKAQAICIGTGAVSTAVVLEVLSRIFRRRLDAWRAAREAKRQEKLRIQRERDEAEARAAREVAPDPSNNAS